MLLLNMLIYKKILLNSLLFLFFISSSYSNDINYDNWLISLKSDALKRGISEETFNTVMKNVIITPKVKKLDKKQPETQITFNDYFKRTVNKHRVNIGKKNMNNIKVIYLK